MVANERRQEGRGICWEWVWFGWLPWSEKRRKRGLTLDATFEGERLPVCCQRGSLKGGVKIISFTSINSDSPSTRLLTESQEHDAKLFRLGK